MAVSKRLRFEILRRDNHTCRYCGATAPDVRIVVDHVVPEALGGPTEPGNLVTACEPCNSGKTSIAPDSPLVEDVRQDSLRWARAVEAAVAIRVGQAKMADDYVMEFYNSSRTVEALSPRRVSIEWPDNWETSIRTFHKNGLPIQDAIRAYERADESLKIHSQGGWKYFCGIGWSMLAEIHQVAREILLAEED